MNKIIMKYHSQRMFLTLDITKMFELVFTELEACEIILQPMNSQEINNAIDNSSGIDFVKERFKVYELVEGKTNRCKNLEKMIIQLGFK